MMIRKHFAASAIMLAVALVLSGCHTGSEKHTSAVSQQSGSNASATQSSSSSLSSTSSASPSSKPVDSSTGSSQPSDLLKVQSTVQKTMPYGDYIIGWLNSGTVLYRSGIGKISSLRAYTPQTGADSVFLLPHNGILSDTSISPDGKCLTYDLTETNSTESPCDLYAMNLATKSVTELYRNMYYPQWADNSHILFRAGSQKDWNEPILIDLSGHVTKLPGMADSMLGGTFRYGPLANNRLFYLAGSMQVPNDLYAYDLASGRNNLLTRNLDCLFPSPDQRYFFTEAAVNVSLDNGSQNIIELINQEGKEERVIRNTKSSSREGDIYSAAWSPNGKYVAYSITPDDKADAGVYLYNPTQNTSTRIESCSKESYGTLLDWSSTRNCLACTLSKGTNNNLNSVFKVYYFES